MRSTLSDIAKAAGVSSATVDRVLNDREGVRARTRELVLETARELGYIGDLKINTSSADHVVRLDFVLPAGTNMFMADLARNLDDQAQSRNEIAVNVHLLEGFNPDTLASKLEDLRGNTDGIGLIALDHPTVREAIRSLASEGIKIATLVSDIHHVPNAGYIGIDNRAAGRLAGYLLGRFLDKDKPHKIALFAGSLSYRGHEEREMGFRNVLTGEFPHIEVVELREMKDDRERAYREAKSMLETYPDLAGIYNIGAGNQGIARALESSGREKAVVFIGHELTEQNKLLLLNGTMDAIIDQNPRVEAREALKLLENAVRGIQEVVHPPRVHVVFKENIPEV